MARHGGGAFSGKDPSKVDRSAAYAARYVAKNIVAAGLAIEVSAGPTRSAWPSRPRSRSPPSAPARSATTQIEKLIRASFDLRPYGIIKMLDLIHPMYQQTAAYGHFGRKPVVNLTDGAGKADHRVPGRRPTRPTTLRKAAKLK